MLTTLSVFPSPPFLDGDPFDNTNKALSETPRSLVGGLLPESTLSPARSWCEAVVAASWARVNPGRCAWGYLSILLLDAIFSLRLVATYGRVSHTHRRGAAFCPVRLDVVRLIDAFCRRDAEAW